MGDDPNELLDQYEARNDQIGEPLPWEIGDHSRRNLLAQQAALSGKFAHRAEEGYAAYGAQGRGVLDAISGVALGQNSVSAEQLRQGLQQNVAAQRSLAAGASPQHAAMAARTAAIQSGRLGAGLSGQQAAAGLQERNQAWQQYGSLLGTLRGQDLSAALTARQTANAGYGAAPFTPQKDWIETYGPAIQGGLSAYAASDRRLKTDVKDGGKSADRMLSALKAASSYRYKDGERHGKGKYTGVMAQDLERAGSRAVVDTPGGKMVHGARLATENTAMLAALRDRVTRLEGGKGR